MWDFSCRRLVSKPSRLHCAGGGFRGIWAILHRGFPGEHSSFSQVRCVGHVVEIPEAGHFCQEDKPEVLVALIEQFAQVT
jgi:hypothetical protein